MRGVEELAGLSSLTPDWGLMTSPPDHHPYVDDLNEED
jgi:hypothetical protein